MLKRSLAVIVGVLMAIISYTQDTTILVGKLTRDVNLLDTGSHIFGKKKMELHNGDYVIITHQTPANSFYRAIINSVSGFIDKSYVEIKRGDHSLLRENTNPIKEKKAIDLSHQLDLFKRLDSLEHIRDSITTNMKAAAYVKHLHLHGLIIDSYEVSGGDYTTGFTISVTNGSTKTIKYIHFTAVARNAVNDIIATKIPRGIGPIKKDESGEYSFEDVFYSKVVDNVKITKIEVQYMDGTRKIYTGAALKQIWNL